MGSSSEGAWSGPAAEEAGGGPRCSRQSKPLGQRRLSPHLWVGFLARWAGVHQGPDPQGRFGRRLFPTQLQ